MIMMAMIIMIVMIHDNDDEKICWGFLWLTPRYTSILLALHHVYLTHFGVWSQSCTVSIDNKQGNQSFFFS